MQLAFDRLVGDGHPRPARRDLEDVPRRPVRPDHAALDAPAIRGVSQDRGTGAVADEDAGPPVFPVDQPAERLRADHEHPADYAGLYHLSRGDQPVDEARAGREEVEGAGALRPDPLLHQAGRGWEEHVGRGRADDDEVEIFRGYLRVGEGPLGGHDGQV